MIGRPFGLVVALCFAGAAFASAGDAATLLQQVATIDLPGPAGKRFDYLIIDYDDGWLFSAHLAAKQTYVIDLKTNRVLHTILDTPGVEGVTYVPDGRKLYTSNAGDNTVGVVDLQSMKVVKKLPTEAKPDGSTCRPIELTATKNGQTTTETTTFCQASGSTDLKPLQV